MSDDSALAAQQWPPAILDPILARHIEARNAALRAQWKAAGFADPAHYLCVLQERASRYAAHVASMAITPSIASWMLGMRARYLSDYVQCHHYIADWLTALLIVRYGEEPSADHSTDQRLDDNGARIFAGWPTTLSAQDLRRAAELLEGKNWPGAFTLLPHYEG